MAQRVNADGIGVRGAHRPREGGEQLRLEQFVVGQSQRLGGDCVKALRSYDAYLRTNPAPAEQVKTKKNIERCEQDLKDRPPPVTEIAPPIVVEPGVAPAAIVR